MKEYEELNYKLQDDLKDAYHQLQVRGSELSSNKVELLKHRQEIDVSLQNKCICVYNNTSSVLLL